MSGVLYAYVTARERTLVSITIGAKSFPCVFTSPTTAEQVLPIVALTSVVSGELVQLVKYLEQEIIIGDVTAATSTASQGD